MTETDGMRRPADADLDLYEKRIDALMMLMAAGATPVAPEAHRRTQECLKHETFADGGYYDRWLLALRDNLVSARVLDAREIEERVASLRGRQGEHGR